MTVSRKVALIAGKLPRYAGKALRAGDTFFASRTDARALVAAKLATYATVDHARAPAIAKAPPVDTDERATLRADYEALAQKKPLGFWHADKLRAEIEKLRAERDATPGDTETSSDEDNGAETGDAA